MIVRIECGQVGLEERCRICLCGNKNKITAGLNTH